jgi:hypothetical protein
MSNEGRLNAVSQHRPPTAKTQTNMRPPFCIANEEIAANPVLSATAADERSHHFEQRRIGGDMINVPAMSLEEQMRAEPRALLVVIAPLLRQEPPPQ